jgi:hypothetical protein
VVEHATVGGGGGGREQCGRWWWRPGAMRATRGGGGRLHHLIGRWINGGGNEVKIRVSGCRGVTTLLRLEGARGGSPWVGLGCRRRAAARRIRVRGNVTQHVVGGGRATAQAVLTPTDFTHIHQMQKPINNPDSLRDRDFARVNGSRAWIGVC